MENPDDLAKTVIRLEELVNKLIDRSTDSSTAAMTGQLIVQMARINAQMFDGTVRSLQTLNADLTSEIKTLRVDNGALRKELDEAKTNKIDREFQIALHMEANQRADRLTEQMLRMLQEKKDQTLKAV